MNLPNHDETAIHDKDDMAVINFINNTIVALNEDNDDNDDIFEESNAEFEEKRRKHRYDHTNRPW